MDGTTREMAHAAETMRQAAFLQSQIPAALAEIEVMKAENREREERSMAHAHSPVQFMEVIDKYGLGRNAAITTLSVNY